MLCAAALTLGACASSPTKLVSTWAAPASAGYAPKKILVTCPAKEQSMRLSAEVRMSQLIPNSVTSTSVFLNGEEGDKGWLLWEVDAEGADFTLHPTPARRTLDLCFEGKPDLDAVRRMMAEQEVAGAFVLECLGRRLEGRVRVLQHLALAGQAGDATVDVQQVSRVPSGQRAAGTLLVPDGSGGGPGFLAITATRARRSARRRGGPTCARHAWPQASIC